MFILTLTYGQLFFLVFFRKEQIFELFYFLSLTPNVAASGAGFLNRYKKIERQKLYGQIKNIWINRKLLVKQKIYG